MYKRQILDTAGRLHVDEDMMAELQEIKETVTVHQTLLVVDAMTGQDAVNVAKEFDEKVGVDGVILSKMDGDTRGGAAPVSYTHLNGYLVLKLFFQIGKKEQKKRLEELEGNKDTAWRVGENDWWQNKHYDKCEEVYDKYLTDTNASVAPWYLSLIHI